jgi:hypothetical protein
MRRLFFLVAIFFGGLLFTNNTLAQAPAGPECPGYWRAGICFPATTGLSNVPVYDILYSFVWWLLAIVGFIGIIAFVISGMQYLLSAGNEEMVKTAKSSMKYSIIGMVVALSGLVIIFAVDAVLRGFSYF